jgi:hypothetical protein
LVHGYKYLPYTQIHNALLGHEESAI